MFPPVNSAIHELSEEPTNRRDESTSLEASFALHAQDAALDTLVQTRDTAVYASAVRSFLAILVSPDTIVLQSAVQVSVLVLSDAVSPFLANRGAVDHDVNLLRVEPRLGVLVAIALNADNAIDDHELDVAVALVQVSVDGAVLIFASIPVDLETVLLFVVELLVHALHGLFISPALEWQRFALRTDISKSTARSSEWDDIHHR